MRLPQTSPSRPSSQPSRAEGRYTGIDLYPLNELETAQLAGQAAGHDLNAVDTARIYREAEGNPLFVIETVRLGGVAIYGGSASSDPLAASDRAQAVLARRIDQLSPGTRELTGLAATIGREFTLDVLRQASGEGDEPIVRALDELLQRRIVQEICSGCL